MPTWRGIDAATFADSPLRLIGGWFEFALGLVVLLWPTHALLMFVFVWKLGTEALRPLAGEPIWEFIERGGSYGAPLALSWLLSRWVGTSGQRPGGSGPRIDR